MYLHQMSVMHRLQSKTVLHISPVNIWEKTPQPQKNATKGFSIDSVRFSCTLQHTKSLPKSEPRKFFPILLNF